MPAQIFLATPPDTTANGFARSLAEALAATPVAALYVQRGPRPAKDYEAFARSVIVPAQAANCAVLLDADPGLATALGADGVHLGGTLKPVRTALGALKPDRIVGTGPLTSRHEAMTLAEAGVDYVLFGSFTAGPASHERDLALWWTRTFKVPAVLFDDQSPILEVNPAGCEFAGVGANIWNAPEGPRAALSALATSLETL